MQVTVLRNLHDYILCFLFSNMGFFVLKLLNMKTLKFAPSFNLWGLYATPIIANANNSLKTQSMYLITENSSRTPNALKFFSRGMINEVKSVIWNNRPFTLVAAYNFVLQWALNNFTQKTRWPCLIVGWVESLGLSRFSFEFVSTLGMPKLTTIILFIKLRAG